MSKHHNLQLWRSKYCARHCHTYPYMAQAIFWLSVQLYPLAKRWLRVVLVWGKTRTTTIWNVVITQRQTGPFVLYRYCISSDNSNKCALLCFIYMNIIRSKLKYYNIFLKIASLFRIILIILILEFIMFLF